MQRPFWAPQGAASSLTQRNLEPFEEMAYHTPIAINQKDQKWEHRFRISIFRRSDCLGVPSTMSLMAAGDGHDLHNILRAVYGGVDSGTKLRPFEAIRSWGFKGL
jgi:hypothetical protein